MATMVGIFNFFVNFINTLVSIWMSYGFFSGPLQYLGGLLVFAGLYGEWKSEEERKRFKSKPSSRGRLYTGGLFALARHINYV